MSHALIALFWSLVFCLTGALAQAQDPRIGVTIDPGKLPSSYRVESGLHLSAREAYRAVTSLSGVVLIDVRTHEETLFNGVAAPMHRHIPYVVPDLDHSYDPVNRRYKLEPNPDFVKAVDNLLVELKLDRKAAVILYCSVGERSARAANLLLRSGFASVYSLAEGFEGDLKSELGPGWKASGLPWTNHLRPEQAYKSPAM